MAEAVSTVWEFPCLSQEFRHGPEILLTAEGAHLRYDFESPSGGYSWAEVFFEGVFAFRYYSYDSLVGKDHHSHVVDAYDRVVEVHDSRWLLDVCPAEPWVGLVLHHYRVFFDSIGVYEFAAKGFDPNPDGE